MPQTVCHICGSDKWRQTEDHLDGHTLMDQEQWCETCEYEYRFSTGNYEEVIGRWTTSWHHTETAEEEQTRRAARKVATLIRRHELNWNFGGMKSFVEALAADPHETSTALVLADWIDEHSDQIDPHSVYQNYPDILRQYTDSSGFPSCPDCGGAGEYYSHSSDCEFRFCALAGGPEDCSGAIVRCECQPCLECKGSGMIRCSCGCGTAVSCDCRHA